MRDIDIKDWPGLDPKIAKKLDKKLYITKLKQFLGFSGRKSGLRERLKSIGLTDAKIRAMRKDAKRLLAALPEVKIVGVLEDYSENGTEGVVWAVKAHGKKSYYERLHRLEKGDHLLVTDETGAVRFDGIIEPNRKKGWEPYPLNPKHGQPSALGMWIHWTQEDWEPDDWARLFMCRKGPPLHAVLTINPKR